MALRGTNQESGRPFNRRIVLESIRLHGPTTRGDVAERVGLTVQTVSTIVRELEDQGLLLSVREKPKGRGIPPSALTINPEGGHAVGIHLTPLGIEAALVNLRGDVVESRQRPAPNAMPDEAFALIGDMVADLKTSPRQGRLLGAGLALPGPFDVDSMSFVGPTTMAGWKNVDIRQRLADATGLPAFMENDMAAAALGEQLYGLGQQFSDYFYLFFSVGLGGAMMHDGVVMRGAWGNAGEIGHIAAIPDGELCHCGNRGCLERYLSLDAFKRSGLSEDDWVDAIAPIFRSAVRTIENLFDPETIVLGGLAPQSLIERLATLSDGLTNSISARTNRTVPRVVVASDCQRSALRGAAALAVFGVLSPRFGQMFETSEKGIAV
ncbi:ROK family transcriptional regulator [Agrobacterium vitis]|uniref:ROK family protein n=1 Tax=Agrobacterium vitis TaxID=373 RepID=A0AAE5AV86_AGRVI|nr:ROK family transcriptional regulator [Agrobacterium vitis]MCF1497398.1 ROK family transcriptional regulator [Allorhizobium sp. Av2]MCM2438907.1 ROK family transcriptional regulator [Agrobacterium vitis]MUZ56815.1 ROK family protein [Agrobacterium vitis]MVA65033.1 ROK family protein [Agrobacterium vitis]MVA86048.1 ROK family protein [Agrobacterium vitis]